jgi:hypothetical protein
MIILPSAKGFPLKPALIKDPYYSSVTALLHMSGTNGSTTFIDNSPNGYIITQFGGISITTAQSKFNNGSANFDGSAGYLRMPTGVGSIYGFTNWTCECWIYPTLLGNLTLVDFYIFGQGGFTWSITNSGYLAYNDGRSIVSSATFTINAWNHIVVSRLSAYGAIYFFINGSPAGFGTPNSAITPTQPVYIGANSAGNNKFKGYMCDLRFTKGVARYSPAGNYTMPISPFPNA